MTTTHLRLVRVVMKWMHEVVTNVSNLKHFHKLYGTYYG